MDKIIDLISNIFKMAFYGVVIGFVGVVIMILGIVLSILN